MRCCVLTFAAKGTGAGTQVVTGVADSAGAFTPTKIMFFGNSAVNTIAQYYQRSSGIDSCDGVFKKSLAQQEGLQNGGSLKHVSYSASGVYSVLGHTDSIFFGGSTERAAAVTAVASGQFTLTYALNTFTGDSIIAVVFGGVDLSIAISDLQANSISVGFDPAAIILEGLPEESSTVTSTGGGSDSIGWATQSDAKFGSSASVVGSQGKNGRYQRDTLCFTQLDYDIIGNTINISKSITLNSWTGTGATFSAGGSSTTRAVALGGTGVLAKTIVFNEPASTGVQNVLCGIAPKFVLLSSIGLAAGSALDSAIAMLMYGFMSETGQASLISGESKATDGPPLTGFRYLSNADTALIAVPNALLTTFSGRATSAGFNSTLGSFGLNWSVVSGDEPQILALVIGEAITPASPSSGIYFLDPSAVHDTLYLTYDPVTTTTVKIP